MASGFVCFRALAFFSFLVPFFDAIGFLLPRRIRNATLRRGYTCVFCHNYFADTQWLGGFELLRFLQALGALAGFLRCHGFSPSFGLPPWAVTRL
jgi:hypothetical protein